MADSRGAAWEEPVNRGFTASRVAIGVNHSAQSWNDFKIFLAGALASLAGTAILAAAVEAARTHTHDWETLLAAARRPKERAPDQIE